MKIGQLLNLAGLDRQAFASLERRGHLDFLKRDAGEGVDRFGRVHALAIVAFAQLRGAGLAPANAAEVIKSSWAVIRAVAERDSTSSPVWIGIVRNSLGVVRHLGDQIDGADPERNMLEIKVNLTEFNADIRRALAAEAA